MMQGGDASVLLPLSPSFSSYSSGRFAEIAARVVEEFRIETDNSSDIFDWKTHVAPDESPLAPHETVDDDDFEFAVALTQPETETISAEDIFHNGQIRPIYPLFNANLLSNGSILANKTSNDVDGGGGGLMKQNPTPNPNQKRAHRPSLGKLMSEEREASSCSSSEADELDGVLPGTYCVWSPKESLERCKKSNSMGSSKRWKLRDLLYRSNSDGKDTFVFLAQTSKKIAESGTGDEKTAGKVKSSRVAAAAANSTAVTEDNT